MNQIKISKMCLYDLDKLMPHLLKNFGSSWNYKLFENELTSDNSFYIILKHEDIILGFAGLSIQYDEGHIMTINTNIEFRNKGFGSLLLEELIKLGKKQKLTKLTLEVRESNLIAQNLYKKYDFKVVGLRKNYYNILKSNSKENAIIMDLCL